MKIFVLNKQKIIRYFMVLAIIGLVFSFAGNIATNMIATVAKANKEVPIYCVDTENKDIALTFDCAWGGEDMPKILDILKKHEVKASFFVLGEWTEKFPDIIKRMSEDGHDIANHSDTHPHIASLPYEKIKEEIKNANEKIEKLTNKKNNLFRAPYGEYNNNVINAAEELGFYTIQWDVDSLDWKNFGKQNILNRVMNKTKNGSIILMHNGTEDTADVLEELIKELKDKGFNFKPVSELIYKDNYKIDNMGKQIKI